ncbi:MAG: thioredoxin family protein [Myxococcaceae bacterium]|nr:thioredoxin family protein [Myxococcaceae bacterium]
MSCLTPCVYPLIPMTLSVIGVRRNDSHWNGFLLTSTYVSGMVLLYCTLGILFASVGWLAGSLLQSPWINLALASFLLAMAANLFGLYSWALPPAWHERLDRLGPKSGYLHAFTMGLFAGLIAAPCTGPILALILTSIASKHHLAQAIYDMIAYSLGMGFPFLILGTFSSAIRYLPKSGHWMNRIKFALGALLIFASLGYGFRAYKGFSSRSLQAFEQVEAEIRLARSQNKKIILDFWAEWCTLCQELDEKTLKNPEVQKVLENFALIRIDVSHETPKSLGLQEAYKVVGLPTLVFLDSGRKVSGFVEPKTFLKLLRRSLRH